MHNMLACNIVIRTLNEERFLPRLLAGIKNQLAVKADVIVVDSGSTDRTTDIAENAGATVIRIPRQAFTFGYALNVGLEACTHDFAAIVSGHTYPANETWLLNLMSPFSDKNISYAYGRQIGNESTKFSEKCLFANWFPDGKETKQDYPFCNNANSAVRLSVWKTHKFNEAIPALEDMEYARRLLLNGHGLAYCPQATLFHIHEEPYGTVYKRYYREGIALRQIFPDSKPTVIGTLTVLLRHVCNDSYLALKDRKFFSELLSIIAFRYMFVIGSYRGRRLADIKNASLAHYLRNVSSTSLPKQSQGQRR